MFNLPERVNPIFHSINEFELLFQIGEGAFSVVYDAIHLQTNYSYAIKIVDFSKLSLEDQENIQKEIQAHKLMNHKNIVSLYDYFKEGNTVYFIMELCERDNLFQYIIDGRLDNKEKKKVFKQCCDAVAYVHNKQFIIRDIKPENILLDKYKNIKLCDFGWASHITDKEFRKLKAGTLTYMSPESIAGLFQGFPSDIWSLGVLLYELYHNKEPYVGTDLKNMLFLINKGNLEFDKELIDKDAEELIKRLLTVAPHKRPVFEEIYSSSYLNNYDIEQSLKDIEAFKRDVSVHKYEKKLHNNFTNKIYEPYSIKPKIITKQVKQNTIVKTTLPLKNNEKIETKIEGQQKRSYILREEKEFLNIKESRLNKRSESFNKLNLFSDINKINFKDIRSSVSKKPKTQEYNVNSLSPVKRFIIKDGSNEEDFKINGEKRVINFNLKQRSKTPNQVHFYRNKNIFKFDLEENEKRIK